MSGPPKETWPPIITGAKQTVWIRWRGVAVTTFMWGLFLFLLEKEIRLAWRTIHLRAGPTATPVELYLEPFLAGMLPTLGIILALVIFLGLAALASRRRGYAALGQDPPTPLHDTEIAADLGLTEMELNDLRRLKIVALDVDVQGRVTVRPDWKPPAGRSDG